VPVWWDTSSTKPPRQPEVTTQRPPHEFIGLRACSRCPPELGFQSTAVPEPSPVVLLRRDSRGTPSAVPLGGGSALGEVTDPNPAGLDLERLFSARFMPHRRGLRCVKS